MNGMILPVTMSGRKYPRPRIHSLMEEILSMVLYGLTGPFLPSSTTSSNKNLHALFKQYYKCKNLRFLEKQKKTICQHQVCPQ